MNDDENPSDPEEPKQVVDPRSWQERLKAQLREDLNQEISDMDIDEAVERYRQDIIEYMVRSGELIKERRGKRNFYKRIVWSGTGNELNPGSVQFTQEVEEKNIEIPYPEDELYYCIIVDIWKHHAQNPTWSTQYLEGTKSIRKDPRSKIDSYGLTLNDHAIIFWYANKAGYYNHLESDRKKMNSYIERHRLDVSINSFKTLVAKYPGYVDRCESKALNRIRPYVEHWYFNGLAYLQSDQQMYLMNPPKSSRK